jgi:hypothetical protein
MALHVPFGILAMIYILVKMRLTFHIPSGTLAMAYILIKMCLTFHVPFRTLDMAYIPFKTCLALVIVNILIKMYCAHNKSLDASFKAYTKNPLCLLDNKKIVSLQD